ncbi:cilia- and flagella-associated protein 47-like isoform X2 [Watersipora subatra]|uniref:cilia- and flagella-associated protein 47-like isoform X2 n=1 Tax=Watersipora subatra TaxID=2589382 RepID=UPI00355BD6CC
MPKVFEPQHQKWTKIGVLPSPVARRKRPLGTTTSQHGGSCRKAAEHGYGKETKKNHPASPILSFCGKNHFFRQNSLQEMIPVETDLSFLGGKPVLTVLEGQLGKYELTAVPKRRGKFTGIVAFVAGKNPVVQYDSDGDEVVGSDNEDDEYNGYKVWYSVTSDIAPAPAERSICIRCNCQKRAVVEMGVKNPTENDIKLEVDIHGMGLSGEKDILVPAKGSAAYELVFFSTCIGETKGSIIFYHDATGEFWYEIDLIAENPAITDLPEMSCELGRWTQQMISLTNPTSQTLEFVPTMSNANNFSLELDDQRPIVIKAEATLKVLLNFMLTSLGQADHKAKITFNSEEFGEWVFTASGKGTLPQPQEPVSLSSPAGANSTVIIPFRNPLDTTISVDVVLTGGWNNNPTVTQFKATFRKLMSKCGAESDAIKTGNSIVYIAGYIVQKLTEVLS